MIAITACAAALAVVTVGLLLRSEYEKKHFVTDQYEIELSLIHISEPTRH